MFIYIKYNKINLLYSFINKIYQYTNIVYFKKFFVKLVETIKKNYT